MLAVSLKLRKLDRPDLSRRASSRQAAQRHKSFALVETCRPIELGSPALLSWLRLAATARSNDLWNYGRASATRGEVALAKNVSAVSTPCCYFDNECA